MEDAPKHSPGPWRWRPIPGVPGRIEVLSADGKYIGILWSLGDGQPRDADAALIASAPTLAAKLAEAVGLLTAARGEGWLDGTDIGDMVAAFLARVDGDGKMG